MLGPLILAVIAVGAAWGARSASRSASTPAAGPATPSLPVATPIPIRVGDRVLIPIAAVRAPTVNANDPTIADVRLTADEDSSVQDLIFVISAIDSAAAMVRGRAIGFVRRRGAREERVNVAPSGAFSVRLSVIRPDTVQPLPNVLTTGEVRVVTKAAVPNAAALLGVPVTEADRFQLFVTGAIPPDQVEGILVGYLTPDSRNVRVKTPDANAPRIRVPLTAVGEVVALG